MSKDFAVVTSHPDLILYVDALQKKNAEALSFYPRQVFERESEKGRIFLGLLNGQPCGYLYVGASGSHVRCHQVCIQYDARRRLYGATLVAHMEAYAEASDSLSITLRCGFDLDANTFWRDMGYSCVTHKQGGIRRQRVINVWRKELMPSLFGVEHITPAEGKTDASVWAKHRHLGVVNQFSRGKRLDQYRHLVLSKR